VSVGTAFYPRQRELNRTQAWGEWAGYFSPAVYADFHDIEYSAIREAAAVIDTTPLYKYIVRGPDAVQLLDRVITRDATRIRVDQVIYTPWCDDDGKVLDDGTITRLSEHEFRITAADPCYRWFVLNATALDVEVLDVSEQLGALALQGKLSREVLEAATRQDWSTIHYFGHRRSEIGGVEVSVTRTGYTGDRGYEIWIPVDGALEVWDQLFEAGEPYGIHPAGIRALDVARVEAGLILLDAEYTSARHAMIPEQNYSPFELGLGRLVAMGKETEFTGKRALLAEQASGGPARRLVGLELDWAGIEGMFARHGLAAHISLSVQRPPVPVYREGKQIGRATSITWGTTIKKMVGFGSLDARFEAPGTRVSVEYSVEGERGKVAATVVPLPFLDLPRKRT
jgi:aminomethyltransferase